MFRVLYLSVHCPNKACGKSLLTDEYLIKHRPSVHLIAEKEGKRGDIYLSAYYDDFQAKEPIEPNILPGDIIKFYCPHCGKELPFKETCYCGAPVVTLAVEGGGDVKFCTRNGCKYHALEFEHAGDLAAFMEEMNSSDEG